MKLSKPIYPTDEQQQMLRKDKTDNYLRGAAVAVDTDLILDICILYTNEALTTDFSGRFVLLLAFVFF